MDELTPRQAEILELIRSHVEATGFPPTRAEIAQALGFRSVNAAEEHVKALVKKGLIELLPNASRGIRLTQGQGLPVVGKVAAGKPILAQQNIEGSYQIERRLFTPSADYLLRVRGQSMIGAGIIDGDLLAVHRTPEARSGQIV
ncbi:MAG: transcriptional repressor LexA, partial [Burkholderiales bacterium]